MRCPRCGREGRLEVYESKGRRYLRVVHGSGRSRERCYLGPADGYEHAAPLLLLPLTNLADFDYASVIDAALSIFYDRVRRDGLERPSAFAERVRGVREVLERYLPRLRRLEEELRRLARQFEEEVGEGADVPRVREAG